MTSKILVDAGPSEAGWSKSESAHRCERLHYLKHIKAWVTDENLQIVAVEWEVGAIIECPTIAPYWAEKLCSMLEGMKLKKTQRLDLVVKDIHQRYLIIDHKLTSSPATPASIRSRYTLSGQFILMRMFGRGLYQQDFGGAMVNLIQVPSKDKPTQFCRDAPDVAPHAMQLFPLQLHRRHERLDVLNALNSPEEEYLGAWNEQVCNGPYGKCEAFSACQWGDL